MTARVPSRSTGLAGILAAGLIVGGLCQASDNQPATATSERLAVSQANRLRGYPSADPVRPATSIHFVQNDPPELAGSDTEAKPWFKLPTLRFHSANDQSDEPTATVAEGRRFDPDVKSAAYGSQRGQQPPMRRDPQNNDRSELRFFSQRSDNTTTGRAAPAALPPGTMTRPNFSPLFANLPFFHRPGTRQTQSPRFSRSLPPMARQPQLDRSVRPPQAWASSQPVPPQSRPPIRRSAYASPTESRAPKAAPATEDSARAMTPIAEPKLVSPKIVEKKTETTIDAPVAKLLKRAHDQSETAKSEADYSRIINTCRKTLSEQPSDEVTAYTKKLSAWALNRRGQLKADAGHNQDAFADFADAIEMDSHCWRAIHNQGVLRAEAGDLKTAFDDFNRTIELNPKFAKAYVNRGSLAVVAGDFYAALRDYRQAITVNPELALAHKGRGQVNHILGNLTEAQRNFDTAAELAPEDAAIAVARADLLTDLGLYDDARAEYERAMELDSELAQAYRGSAWLLATCPEKRVRDSEKALDDAYAAMELDGRQDPANLDTLAAALANSGDFDGAVAAQKRAITLASETEREIYESRLDSYEQAKPFRISPIRRAQATEPIEK